MKLADIISFCRREWIFITATTLIILGLGLRLYQIGIYPPPTETQDEYAWIFLGGSLIQTGIPRSWSYFNYNQVESREIQGSYYPIVTPSFDHPPLFSLLPGVIQTLAGKPWDDPLPLSILRLSVIPLSLLSMILLYKIAATYFEPKYALLSLAFYSLIPAIVFAHRIIVAEQLLTPIILGLLVADLPPVSKPKNYWLIILSAAALLTKVIGVVFPIFLVIYYLVKGSQRWRYPLVGIVIGLTILCLYGIAIDFQQFTLIQISQGALRHSTMVNLLGLLVNSKLVATYFLDGLLLLGLITWFGAIVWDDKYPALWKLFSVGYLGVLWLVMGETTSNGWGGNIGKSLYGWYLYPLFPFLVLALTASVKKIIVNFNLGGFTIWWLIAILQLRYLFYQWRLFTLELMQLPKILLLCLLFAPGLGFFLPKKLWPTLVLSLVTIILLANIYQVLFFDPNYMAQTHQYLSRYLE